MRSRQRKTLSKAVPSAWSRKCESSSSARRDATAGCSGKRGPLGWRDPGRLGNRWRRLFSFFFYPFPLFFCRDSAHKALWRRRRQRQGSGHRRRKGAGSKGSSGRHAGQDNTAGKKSDYATGRERRRAGPFSFFCSRCLQRRSSRKALRDEGGREPARRKTT